METSLAKTESPTPMQLLAMAIDNKVDVAKLEKLMDLAAQWKRDQAAEDFAQAMTAFQAECPVVFKSRTAKAGNFQYQYAGFDDVMRQAAPVLAKTGLVVTFDTEALPMADAKAMTTTIKVTCKVRKGTHAEQTTIQIPIPAGVVNSTQLMGQAISYGKRYAIQAALNIVVTDEDDDGGNLAEFVSEEQVKELAKMLTEKKVGEKAFLSWMQADSLDKVLRRDYDRAVDFLRRRKVGAA